MLIIVYFIYYELKLGIYSLNGENTSFNNVPIPARVIAPIPARITLLLSDNI